MLLLDPPMIVTKMQDALIGNAQIELILNMAYATQKEENSCHGELDPLLLSIVIKLQVSGYFLR